MDVGLDDGHDVQEVVSKPVVNNQSNAAYLLIIFVSLSVVIVSIAASVFIYRKCQEAHRVVIAYV